MSRRGWIIAAAALAVAFMVQWRLMMVYGVWLIWLGFVIWLAWRAPVRVRRSDHPYITFLRRIGLGTAIVTAVNLPVVYGIATLQTSLFGGTGWQLAEAGVLTMTLVIVAPGVFMPLVAVRAAQMWWREHPRGVPE